MSEKKSSKNTSNLATGIAMAASVIPLVKPAIDAVREYADKTIDERKKLVAVPELYSKDYPLTIDQAAEILQGYGLKATLVKMSINDAEPRYRNCFDLQVIKSHPKAKQKVERGTSVLVKYITQEIIDECQRMYDVQEKRKEELRVEKDIKSSERKEKTKQMVSGIIITAKENFSKVPDAFHKNKKQEDQDEQEQ